MAKSNTRILILSLCVLIVLMGLVLFSAGASRSNRLTLAQGNQSNISLPQQPNEPEQVNQQFSRNDKTKALQVEKIEVLPQAVKVSLKNVSTKTIDGIQLSINGGYLQIDLVGAEEEDYQRLLPGAVYEQFLSPGALSQPLEISVLAVTFADQTIDGDPNLAQQIMDNRRGINKQLKHIRPLLEAAINSTNADPIRILDKLKSQVESLPSEDSEDSSAVREGEHQARAEALDRIEFLRQRQIATGALPIRRALASLKNRQDKQIQKGLE